MVETTKELEKKCISQVLSEKLSQFIYEKTSASDIRVEQVIQTLWSGYGHILRLTLKGAACDRVIIKHVNVPREVTHPAGWHSAQSHDRKMRSYDVEMQWYRAGVRACDQYCPVPNALGVLSDQQEKLIVMEDLDASGFPKRVEVPTLTEVKTCATWLANFHACFLEGRPQGLWPVGTYWHLATRPDEFAVMPEGRLKDSAKLIDQRLAQAPWQTLVHGDAKIANFCFSPDASTLAAVDFQYVGAGCGMKDVAYLISSCWDESGCERYADTILAHYFQALNNAVQRRALSVDMIALEACWRELYPLAWADFYRFLLGWRPGHWKIHGYSARMVAAALESL